MPGSHWPAWWGLSVGIGFLYKSFALGLPVTLGLTGWYLHNRDYNLIASLKQDAIKVVIAITIAVGIFALWFALDPDPMAVWQEFVVGENVGKFDPKGPSYLSKLLWGGSSIWSFTAAFLTNPGLLTFPVVAMFILVYRRRHELSNNEQLLLIWIAALFISFALPSQRSGRYLLAAMPAVALLCALNWPRISRKAFITTLMLAGALLAGLAYLAVRLQAEIPASSLGGTPLYSPMFWVLFAATVILLLAAMFIPDFTRPGVNVVALLVLLCFAAFLKPFDGPLGNFSQETQQYAAGKPVWVPCNFRAKDEGHRFALPGADVHGYAKYLKLSASDLSSRYPLFAIRMPLRDDPYSHTCDDCQIHGQRLVIRDRQSSDEIKAMFRDGTVLQTMFAHEVLMSSPTAIEAVVPESLSGACR